MDIIKEKKVKKGGIINIISCILIIGLFSACNSHFDRKVNINSDWKFKKLDELQSNDDNYYHLGFDDSEWDAVSLPHTANIEPLIVNNQWQGTCWYRKTITVPDEYSENKVFLEFEAAMNQSQIWINGSLVKEHNGGYLPIVIDATKYIKKGTENIIAVRLNNTDNAITGPKPLNILDFNMYGGLYRNVWLIIKDRIYISHPVLANKTAGGGVFIKTPNVSDEQATIQIKTHVVNEYTASKSIVVKQKIFYNNQLVHELISDPTILLAESDYEFIDEVEISTPHLWSPKHPNLYILETTIETDGKEIDKEVNRFGIREFTFNDNQLYINGEKIFLRGVNRHQEYPFIGYALSDNAQYRDAKKIKDAGFDFVRLSHYPHSPAFMDACDELGLVVLDAILGWQYYLDSDLFREYCYRSAKELILRDRNHPCVLAWEASLNETQMPIFFMEELHRIVHEEYPGENVYSCGWMNEVYDIYLQARQHRLQHYDSVQLKPYVVSEYGDWEYYSMNAGLNQHQYSAQLRYEKSSRQKRGYGEKRLLQQAFNVQEAHNDNLNTPAFADGYWVMYDYNRGYDDDIEYSGVMDIFRIPKFSYYFFQSQRDTDEHVMINIASYWTPESSTDVKVFSNCEEIALYLNGELIARQKPDEGENTSKLAHPPFTFHLEKFTDGELKAVGYINELEVATDVVKTPENPVALNLQIDESGKPAKAGCKDVLFVYIKAVDDNGTVVPNYTGDINLNITGDAVLLNYNQEVYFEAGIGTALMEIGNSKGKIVLRAYANNLSGMQTIKVD